MIDERWLKYDYLLIEDDCLDGVEWLNRVDWLIEVGSDVVACVTFSSSSSC